ncbi:sialidase family protein [Puia sp.]|jgi:hypothetical protein|uniref:sialidase family protein n=1 Tax=Puia sp. TaxID=2045100 RepID=UPI002F42A46B
MSNIQVTRNSSTNNAHSECAIVINPNNPLQIVTASKRFNNIHTYDFTLAAEFSADGGHTWQNSAPYALPAGATVMTDPTVAWDDIGNVYTLGLVGKNPPKFDTIGMVVYKSTDGGQTWGAPNLIHTSVNDDKQWMVGDTNPASPFHGRIYAVWDDLSTMRFARSLDHGATWIGDGGNTVSATSLTGDSYLPEINVSANGDIYIAWLAGSMIKMLKSTDGGNSFQLTPVAPATGITTFGSGLPSAGGWSVFPGANFRVVTCPTACVSGQTVVVAWDDYRGGASRIYYARSVDGGTSWTTGASGQPLLTGSIPANMQHFFPQFAADPSGVFGCAFYEFGPKPSTLLIDVLMAQSFDGGATFNSYTVTDQPWDPAVDAPWAHHTDGTIDSSVTFIGDYFGIDASVRGFYPLWTDTRTGVQELFTDIVPEKKVTIVINRSTLGEDEIRARRTQPRNSLNGLPVPDAFRVVLDGFTANEIGIHNSSANLAASPQALPATGLTLLAAGNQSTTGSYGAEAQRFTFFFNLDFPNDSAFSFAPETELVTIAITAFSQLAAAQLELIKQPNPFIFHGDPYWLSVDLRFLVVREGQSSFGAAALTGASDAPRFIQEVMQRITPAEFESLPKEEEQSKLFLQPTDDDGNAVFNFALAKVHYIGLLGAVNVRVFFRMFQAQTTSAAFDLSTTYRRWPNNPAGQPIALPGIGGTEFVTIPFFAEKRIDSTMMALTQQTDAANVKPITSIGGPEVDTFFGCWLDINQPFKNVFFPNPVLPARVPASLINGPFTDPSNPALTIQESMLRNLHQCLIAEIAFDPVSIPAGKDPSNWDKLAQRNIAWSDVGSAMGVTTFVIRPTAMTLPAGAQADELMIDWGQLPAGCVASIFLPGAPADTILQLASRMYTWSRFKKVDDYTLQCEPVGITWLPVPQGTEIHFPGMLTIGMPEGLPHNKTYNVVVRQVTHANGKGRIPVQSGPGGRKAAASTGSGAFQWRKVSGAFQLTIPVRNKATLRIREERNLSVLKWIGEAVPVLSRWYPVFQRYLKVIGDRVTSFGGNPAHILPDPTGNSQGKLPGGHHKPPHHGGDKDLYEFTGKVVRLLYDFFGDFDGFYLENREGEHKFHRRERDVEQLILRCWRERLRLTVTVDKENPHRPLSFIVHQPPDC